MFGDVKILRPMPQFAVLNAIHPVLGAMVIFDAGEHIEYGKPDLPYIHGRTLIGCKSRKSRVLFDFSVSPMLAETKVDIKGERSYGHHVADWCNHIIDRARLDV